MAGFHIVSDLF